VPFFERETKLVTYDKGDVRVSHFMKKHIVILASEFKGNEFLEEAQKRGWHVTLVTRKKLLDYPWAWTAINDARPVEEGAGVMDYVRAVTNLAVAPVKMRYDDA